MKKSNEEANKKSNGEVKKKGVLAKTLKGILIFFGSLIVLLAIAAGVVLTQFKLDTLQVTGNIHYTEEEIREIVKEHGYIENTLVLYWMNKLNPIGDIPFVDKLDIEYISNHVVTVTIYEKSIAGCMEYMNRYIYFDKDGIVLDTSTKRLQDIPCISGMKFEHVILYEKLPIENTERFSLILNMTQLITKYSLLVDDVRFTTDDELILYSGDIKVLLGDGSNIEEKMVDLANILERLEGKKGTLHMEKFTRDKGNASFTPE
ncbi:MAG: hypothetical protein K2G89_02520 [Lachnospiraceae bacterium]|nr:hypothetical protein [Lachnospiraceae bacterium]